MSALHELYTACRRCGLAVIVLFLCLIAAAVAQVPPSIAVAPPSITLSVKCDGTAPLVYQWFKGTVAIAGATGSVYVITDPKATGTYSVKVSNAAGSTTSGTVKLGNTTTLTNPDVQITRKQKP